MDEQKEPGAALRIEQHGLSPYSTRVWLNGQELTRCLDAVTVRYRRDEITTATLEIGVSTVEMDARTIAHLIAHAHEGDPALIEQTIRALKQIKAGVVPQQPGKLPTISISGECDPDAIAKQMMRFRA